jgi:hypothetical protein
MKQQDGPGSDKQQQLPEAREGESDVGTEKLVQQLLQLVEAEDAGAEGKLVANAPLQKKKQIDSGNTTHKVMNGELRIKLLYITANNNEFQQLRLAALSAAFGAELIVIWGKRDSPKCPFTMAHGSLCVDFVELTNTLDTSWAPGHECALTWLLNNRASFDHAWMMEDDVYESEMAVLQCVVCFTRDIFCHIIIMCLSST